jgi:hypothetical protein
MPRTPRSTAGVPGGGVTAADAVAVEAVVALAVVPLLELLLPPQPENAITTRTPPTATGPSFTTAAYPLASDFQTQPGDLPALGVFDHFDRFSGAAVTAVKLTPPGALCCACLRCEPEIGERAVASVLAF